MEQYITNLTKRWIFAVLDVQLRRLENRFYKLCFYRAACNCNRGEPVTTI